MKRLTAIILLSILGCTVSNAQLHVVGGSRGSTNSSANYREMPENPTYLSIYDLLATIPGIEIWPGGVVTIRGEDDPLILYDGVEMFDVSDINPNDVYSVEVIKDSSASIYGIRGMHGVISFKSKFAHETEALEDERNRIENEKDRLVNEERRTGEKASRLRSIADIKQKASELASSIAEKARELKESLIGTIEEQKAILDASRAERKAERALEKAKRAEEKARIAEEEAAKAKEAAEKGLEELEKQKAELEKTE